MAQGRNFVTALMVGTASISMIMAGTTVPVAAQAATGNYKIESQPLGQALMQLSRQANVDIVAPAKITRGRVAKAVAAESVDAALRQMLAGSGLSYKLSGKRYVIQSGNVQGGASQPASAPTRGDDPGNASQGKAPVLTKAPASAVIDSRTGAALKGALVEIIETGEATATNSLGEFRFPGKTGSYNLRFSYLGYPEYQQYVELQDGRATTAIVLTDGSATTDIVVTAYQSARAQALNQERTAENTSTVVSSDRMGQFDGNTISDALRRVPGVAFEMDPQTGDGTNIIVRGLPSSFNTVTLNGQRLPLEGSGRSPRLNNILADSIDKITINKTLLPNQDGSGTGALIDIETKGPLDRPARYLSFSAEKAGSARGFLDETNLSGTASFRFGAEKNFGVSASVQYRKRKILNIGLNGSALFPRYLPAEDDGRPVFSISDIDPRRLFPFEEGVSEIYQGSTGIGQSENEVKNLGIGLSAEWAIGAHTNLKFDYNRNDARTSLFSRFFTINPFSGYRRMPIAELGGEERLARVWEGFIFPGAAVASVSHAINFQPEVRNLTNTWGFQGETNLGPWQFDYRAGLAKGTNTAGSLSVGLSPSSFFLTIDRSQLNDEILANTINGRLISLFPEMGGRVSLPGFNESGFALLNDSEGFVASSASASKQNLAKNTRYSGNISAKYNFRSVFLKYVESGVFYEYSESPGGLGDSAEFYSFTSGSAADLGLPFSEGILDRIGLSNDILAISRRDFLNFYNRLRDGAIPGATTTAAESEKLPYFTGTREKTTAAYLQANIQIGKLEIIGGARLERVKTESAGQQTSFIFLPDFSLDTQWLLDHPPSENLASGVDTTLLPRIQANYRFSDNLVLRAGFYQTIARPDISQLAGNYILTLSQAPAFGPAGNQPELTIQLPNPDLKAAVTNNFDISLEWYAASIGVIKAGLFAKPTKNPFFSNVEELSEDLPDGVELPDDSRFHDPNLFVRVVTPMNADYTTRFWGLELSAERRFDFLPGLWGGFGIFTNYTYTNGKREVRQSFLGDEIVRVLPYSTSPKHSGTAALTFARNGLDASLAYTQQARYLINNASFGMDPYRESHSSLDFKATYSREIHGADLRIFVEASNLLKGSDDPTSEISLGGANGVPKVSVGSNYIGGRSLRGGLSISF